MPRVLWRSRNKHIWGWFCLSNHSSVGDLSLHAYRPIWNGCKPQIGSMARGWSLDAFDRPSWEPETASSKTCPCSHSPPESYFSLIISAPRLRLPSTDDSSPLSEAYEIAEAGLWIPACILLFPAMSIGWKLLFSPVTANAGLFFLPIWWLVDVWEGQVLEDEQGGRNQQSRWSAQWCCPKGVEVVVISWALVVSWDFFPYWKLWFRVGGAPRRLNTDFWRPGEETPHCWWRLWGLYFELPLPENASEITEIKHLSKPWCCLQLL